MNYWTNLFTPETYEGFSDSERTISGFRETQRSMADRVKIGDKFICYMVRMSRWIGVLEVVEGPFVGRTPIFMEEDDPFVIRFKVAPTVWLPLDKTIPIQDNEVFSHLTFTRYVEEGGYWLGPLRRSLQKLDVEDGEFLVSLLDQQNQELKPYEVDSEQYERALKRRIQRPEGSVIVTVPDDGTDDEAETSSTADRESFRVQAGLCRIGEAMGLKIWLPMADRSRVAEHWQPQPGVLAVSFPYNRQRSQ